MSAIRTIPQEDADKAYAFMRDFIEMVKNPKLVEEAYAQQRLQTELTKDEKTKADEARNFIAKSDDLHKALTQREADLQKKLDAHAATVQAFNAQSAENALRLKDLENQLKAERERLVIWNDALCEERKNLDKETADTAKSHSDAWDEIKDARTSNAQQAKLNADKKQEIDELAAAINKRLEHVKLRERAADVIGV